MLDKKLLEEIVFTSPLVLLNVKDKDTIDLANSYLPYSTGFEIECEKKDTYDESIFKAIPNIIWDSYQDSSEQRYRIPNGINGLICLYNICYHLGNNSLMNMGSGIHYHIDCTDTSVIRLKEVLDKDFETNILLELDSWKYGGNYNSRGTSIGVTYGNWIRWNDLNTLEFRIGNMSFDYKVLVKQIIHANDIVRRWKNRMPEYDNSIKYKLVDYKSQIDYQKRMDIKPSSYESRITTLLKEIESSKIVLPARENIDMESIRFSIKSRTTKLY